MGYLVDRLGRKVSLVASSLIIGSSILLMAAFPSTPVLIITNILMGIGSSLGSVTSGPFLMENSGELERTYLFSISSGLQMTAFSVGDWIGGYLPTWFGGALNVNAVSSSAYAWSIGMSGLLVTLAIIPPVDAAAKPAPERGTNPIRSHRFSPIKIRD